MESKIEMQYKYMGTTGLKISRLGFGNWLTSNDPQAKEKMAAMVKQCFDYGINFFDTAEVYGGGEGERQMGNALLALKVPREHYVLTTKIYWSKDGKQNRLGLSRKHILEGMKNSLKRL